MNVIPPIVLTPALMTSSVFEALPAGAIVWSSGVTFALGDYTYVVRSGTNTTYDIFQSLIAGNIAQVPPAVNVSNSFWKSMGSVYKTYVTGTYALNDIVTDSHMNYQSLVATNTALLTDSTKWQNLGPSNMTAVIDNLRNTKTVSPNDIVLSFALGQRAGALAVIGIDATSILIEEYLGATLVYSNLMNLTLRNTKSWKQYYFGKFAYRQTVQVFDLPPYISGRIQITIKKKNGIRGVGGVIIGNAVYLGETQYDPTSDHLNFSTITRDIFGNVTLVPRRSVPKIDLKIQFPKTLVPDILKVRETLNGVPAFWSGLDDDTDPYFEPVESYGVHKQFSLNLSNFAFGVISLEVEEM